MLVAQLSLSQLEPAYAPHLAITRNVRLPYGGPYAVGGSFPRGTILGAVGGTAAAEVRTLTIGTSTGTVINTFVADKPYVVSHLVSDTTAVVQALWEVVFGRGNVVVTGTPGTNYILTFASQLVNTRIGGLMSISSNGTAAWARTTPGSSGAGQFDKYIDAGTNNSPQVARSILAYDYLSDPGGGLVTEGQKTQQGFSPLAYFAGYFNVGDLLGFDAAGLADPGWRMVEGTVITETGAVVGLGV